MYTLICCGIILLAVGVLYYWSGRRYRYLLAQIPGPVGLPLIGCLLDVWYPTEKLLPKSQEWAEEYGGIMKINILGNTRVILTGPEEMEILLKCKVNITKDSCYRFVHPWLGNGVITSTGSKWQSSRRMMGPAFHYTMLEHYVNVFNANTAILVDILSKRTMDEFVQINDLVSLCTLDIICESSMGTSIGAQMAEGVGYVKAVKRICEIFMIRQFSPWLHPDFFFRRSGIGREQEKVLHVLRELTDRVIGENQAEHAKRKTENIAPNESVKNKSLLDILVDLSEKEGCLNAEAMRDEVSTVMFAGHDTVAMAVNAALFELGSHQDIQNKVVAELETIFGSDRRDPTMADLQKMFYLDKVVKEVLRLHPSVPGLSRLLETDLKIGKYTIPAGCEVVVCSYIAHRNPKIFPNPEQFDPERFSPDLASRLHPYAYIPFSSGSRNCIGQKYALLELKCMLSSILRRFKVESVDKKEDITFVMDILLKPKSPFRLRFTLRL